MFADKVKKVGQRVTRYDNERHQGRIEAIFSMASGATRLAYIDSATFRVLWDNGWREDCHYDEIV
jgi:hypothetical protein